MERIKIGEDGASSIEMRQTGRNLNGSRVLKKVF